jgi:Raf kinase inhibitor-like YbhB/YbcL family protein
MRRFGAVLGVLLIGLATIDLPAQNPPPAGGVPPPPAPGGQRGGGRGRGAVQVMTLMTPAWKDGGLIPLRHTQAGDEVSPALEWTNVPETAASFVLVMHDIDAATGDGTSDLLHWLVWNIPGTARQLPEGVPSAAQLADGTRQISGTGPYYRGPGAPATGPPHHYVFELFALDATIEVAPTGASPAETRTAVFAAMAGKVRGKAAMVGMYKR